MLPLPFAISKPSSLFFALLQGKLERFWEYAETINSPHVNYTHQTWKKFCVLASVDEHIHHYVFLHWRTSLSHIGCIENLHMLCVLSSYSCSTLYFYTLLVSSEASTWNSLWNQFAKKMANCIAFVRIRADYYFYCAKHKLQIVSEWSSQTYSW